MPLCVQQFPPCFDYTQTLFFWFLFSILKIHYAIKVIFHSWELCSFYYYSLFFPCGKTKVLINYIVAGIYWIEKSWKGQGMILFFLVLYHELVTSLCKKICQYDSCSLYVYITTAACFCFLNIGGLKILTRMSFTRGYFWTLLLLYSPSNWFGWSHISDTRLVFSPIHHILHTHSESCYIWMNCRASLTVRILQPFCYFLLYYFATKIHIVHLSVTFPKDFTFPIIDFFTFKSLYIVIYILYNVHTTYYSI